MCLSHWIYTVQPCLIHTCHATPMLCSDLAIPLKVTAQKSVERRPVGNLPAFGFFPATTPSSTKVVIRRVQVSEAGGQCETKHRLSWTRKRMVGAHTKKKDDLLHCLTSSSDISGYHADFHEGHGNIGTGQGRCMACVN